MGLIYAVVMFQHRFADHLGVVHHRHRERRQDRGAEEAVHHNVHDRHQRDTSIWAVAADSWQLHGEHQHHSFL